MTLLVTWHLIKRASASHNAAMLFLHIVADITIAAIASLWVLFVVMIAAQLDRSPMTFREMLQVVVDTSSAENYHATLWVAVYVGILGISASLPTVAYTYICGVCLAAKLSPRWLRSLIRRIIYLVATDPQPVFTQLGKWLGGSSAIASVALMYISRHM